jgi:hypothetical protein
MKKMKRMKAKEKALWEHWRMLGKTRYILIMGGFMGGFFFIVMMLLTLWQEGGRLILTFKSFLVRVIIQYFLYGFPVAWFLWEHTEKRYKKTLQEEQHKTT